MKPHNKSAKKKTMPHNTVTHFLLWPLLLVGQLLAVSLIAWHLLAQWNFAYPWGYELLNIDEHIQEFGPNNRFKQDFHKTSTEEHWQIFSEISVAVQNSGKGLAEIDYRLPDGSSARLMREPEVIHLQDVANLIDVYYITAIIGGVIWLLLLAFAYHRRLSLPSLKKILLGFIIGLASISVIVLLIGSKKVFYWLHELIFPDEHEWFFYYQDSLMTTLMKAPDLFGFITVLLVLVTIVFWALSLWGMNILLRARHSAP